jgi:hypothetical protein
MNNVRHKPPMRSFVTTCLVYLALSPMLRGPALGINPAEELYAGDRPVPITDHGLPAAELFT